MLNSIVGTKNGTIIDKGFTSISLCEDINFFNHYPVSFEIQMPKGTKGIITSNLAESEFITQIGTGIEIIGAEVYDDMGDNCIKIYGRIVHERKKLLYAHGLSSDVIREIGLDYASEDTQWMIRNGY